MLRINKLHIKNFRNIDDLDIDLSNQNGLSVLIGNNGSGKSNILEAIVAIFANLYWKTSKYQPNFDYYIEYIYENHTVIINNSKEEILIDNSKINPKELYNYLPKNIIACYSGETDRLQDLFFTPHRKRFVRKRIHGKNAVLNLLFINKDMWDMSLLCLFLHSFDTYTDIKNFCQNTLNIKEVKNIIFDINPNHLTKSNEAKQLIDAISPDQKASVQLTLIQFKTIIEQLGVTPREAFMALYIGYYSHGIKRISIDVEQNNGKVFNASLLSEGEKKLLSVFTMLEVLGDENSLMLYDEPDSQIHISRKGEIKKLVEKYNNRQHIITTHSPTLASAFFDSQEHLLCLAKNTEGCVEYVDRDKSTLISELTDNIWNVSEQNTFLASVKPITLLVEGKTDKIHIEEAFKRLKSNYITLDFDVFSMNSSEHIREVLIGLSSSEIKWNKKFIGIFDNDKAGNDGINKGFEKDSENNHIRHVKYKEGLASSNFYAFLLPKKNGYDAKEAFTIENCYPVDKYQDAFEQAVNDKHGHYYGLSIDKIANDIKNKSKIILSVNCKSFEDGDFVGFKSVFDIVEEISKK